MSEYMTGFLQGMLALGIITWAIGYYIWYKFKRKMIELIEQEQSEEVLAKIVANVERVNGQLYCYDEDDQFICQGVTLNDLTEAYKARYPDKPSCLLLLKGEPALIDELSAGYSGNKEVV
jgi:hypothetical protein